MLQDAAPYFTDSWRSHYATLDRHLEYLASLLGDAPDAGPEAEAALRRAVAYGRDLASFNLSVLLCERSRGAGSSPVKLNISNDYDTGALDLTWRGDSRGRFPPPASREERRTRRGPQSITTYSARDTDGVFHP